MSVMFNLSEVNWSDYEEAGNLGMGVSWALGFNTYAGLYGDFIECAAFYDY